MDHLSNINPNQACWLTDRRQLLILVDDGSRWRYGTERQLRRKVEKEIARSGKSVNMFR